MESRCSIFNIWTFLILTVVVWWLIATQQGEYSESTLWVHTPRGSSWMISNIEDIYNIRTSTNLKLSYKPSWAHKLQLWKVSFQSDKQFRRSFVTNKNCTDRRAPIFVYSQILSHSISTPPPLRQFLHVISYINLRNSRILSRNTNLLRLPSFILDPFLDVPSLISHSSLTMFHK